VSPSLLRKTQTTQVNEAIAHSEAGQKESVPCPLYNLLFVPKHVRNVLYDHNPGLEDHCRPSQEPMQTVSPIGPSRVVVEVRMTLAGRTTNQYIHVADEFSDPTFLDREGIAILAIEEALHWPTDDIG